MATAGKAVAGGYARDPFAVDETRALEADREAALAALREEWKHSYDIGTCTVADANGPILLWLAVRLEGPSPEPLLGFTPAALEAALRDDWGELP